MIHKSLVAVASIAIIAAAPVSAAPCRNGKAKIIKCPPVVKGTVASGGSVLITKDAEGKCHLASGPNKGRLTECP
jgi:hypothetical protein